MLNFKTELYGIAPLGASAPTIRQIAVWDGPNFLAQVDQIAWSGEHSFQPIDIPNDPEVSWGLNISMLVAGTGRVLLRAAGADLHA